MAITVTLDIAEPGATAERYGNAGERASRIGIAEDLPTSGTATEAADVLFKVMTAPGMPAMGSPHPSRPNIALQNLVVIGQGPTWAKFKMLYDGYQGAQSAYIIDVSTIDGSISTNKMPGVPTNGSDDSGKPFTLAFESSDKKYEDMLKPDYAQIILPISGRRITVTKLQVGTMSPEAAEAFNDANELKVNQFKWFDKPPGSWLILNAMAKVSRYAGYFQTQISTVRRGDNVWSYYQTMRSRRTGMMAGGLPGSQDDIEPRLIELLKLPYKPRSIRYPQTGQKKGGVMRIDPFLWANYQTIFGFGTPTDPLGAPFDDLPALPLT